LPPCPAASRRSAGKAEITQVLFNNCYRDWAHVNAQQLTARLGGRLAAG
jgi:hypothetical protein